MLSTPKRISLLATLFAFLFGFVGATPSQANTRMDSLLVNLPQHILPLLNRNARLDLVDYFNAGAKAVAENIHSGESELEALSENYLRIKVTSVSRFEVIRLVDTDTTFLTIETLLSPFKTSRIQRYNAAWGLDSAAHFNNFALESFWAAPDSISAERQAEIKLRLEPLHVFLEADSTTTSLPCPTFYANVCTASLPKECKADAEACLHRVLVALKP